MNNDKQIEELNIKIRELSRRIESLEGRRLFQQDYINDSIKSRHIGEGVRFVRSGLEAKLPTAEEPMQGQPVYWATDSKKLYIYTGSAWVKTAALS